MDQGLWTMDYGLRTTEMHQRRVVITGMGAVTPLGHSVERFYRAACEGKSGVAPITHFDASTFPTTFAAEVREFDLRRFLPDAGRWEKCGLNTRFALAAGKQALEDAGLLADDGRVDRTRFGVYLGCGEGVHDFPNLIASIAYAYRPERRGVDMAAFFRDAVASFDPYSESELELHTTPPHLADAFA